MIGVRIRLWFFLGCAANAVSGCAFEAVPPGVTIRCEVDGGCPAPLACQTGVGICVENVDDTGPNLRLLLPDAGPLLPDGGASEVAIGVAGGTISYEWQSLRVAALGPASSLRFVIVSDEVLAARSTAAVADRPEVSCGTVEESLDSFVVTCTVVANAPPEESDLHVTVSARDINQVENTLRVGPFRFDAVPPGPLGGGTIRLSPWGDFSQLTPTTRLTVGRSRLDGGYGIEVEQPGNPLFPRTILRAVNGTIDGLLSGYAVNGPAPRVRRLDEAGNVGPLTQVDEFEWIATFLAPGASPNPHQCLALRASADGLTGEDFTAESALNLVLEFSMVQVRGAATWKRSGSSENSGRTGVVGAYDPLRSRVIRFGGGLSSSFPDDLSTLATGSFEWVNQAWQERSTRPMLGGTPPGRMFAAMAWHPTRRATLLVGGSISDAGVTGTLRDAWLWTGDSWKRLPDFGRATNQGRRDAVAYFDVDLQQMVIAGGLNGARTPAENAFRLSDEGQWESMSQPDVFVGLSEMAIAVDQEHGTPYIFGGVLSAAQPPRLRGSLHVRVPDAGWVELTAPGPAPVPRRRAAFAYEQSRRRLVLHGGLSDDGGVLDDTWVWPIGGNLGWRELTDRSPGPRAAHTLVSDEARREVVLFGSWNPDGGVISRGENDTWILQGDTWRRAGSSAPLPDRVLSGSLGPALDGGFVRALGLDRGRPVEFLIGGDGWQTAAVPFEALGWFMPRPTAGEDWSLSSSTGALWRRAGGVWSQFDAGVDAATLGRVVNAVPRDDSMGGVDLLVRGLDGGFVHRGLGTGPVYAQHPFASALLSPYLTGSAVLTFPGFSARAQPRLWRDTGGAPVEIEVIGSPISFGPLRNRRSLIAAGFEQPGGGTTNAVWEYDPGSTVWREVPLADPEGEGGPSFTVPPAVGDTSTFTLIERRRETPVSGVDAGAVRTDLAPMAVWSLAYADQKPSIVLRYLADLPLDAKLTQVTLEFGRPRDGLDLELQSRLVGGWGSPVAYDGTRSIFLMDTPSELAAMEHFLRAERSLAFRLQPLRPNGMGTADVSFSRPTLTVRYRR